MAGSIGNDRKFGKGGGGGKTNKHVSTFVRKGRLLSQGENKMYW